MSEREEKALEQMLDSFRRLPESGKAYVEGVAAGMAIMASKQQATDRASA